jgi:hypothetical protein
VPWLSIDEPMLRFCKDNWLGNKWASIEIWPVDTGYFLKLLAHLSLQYGFTVPPIIDILDGYAADFEILGSKAKIHIDSWTFSIAFEQEAVRDRVIAELQALLADFFGTTT